MYFKDKDNVWAELKKILLNKLGSILKSLFSQVLILRIMKKFNTKVIMFLQLKAIIIMNNIEHSNRVMGMVVNLKLKWGRYLLLKRMEMIAKIAHQLLIVLEKKISSVVFLKKKMTKTNQRNLRKKYWIEKKLIVLQVAVLKMI